MLWHEHLRRTAKLLVTGGLHYSGLLDRVRRRHMQERAVILMYHRVFPHGEGVPDYSPNGMSVTPAEFRMQMQFVRRHYEVVPLARIVAAVRGEQEFTPGMCAVTFDDGWHDVYVHAFPLLRELSIPATIFLTTGFVTGTQWYWEERARYLLAVLHAWRGAASVSAHESVNRQLAGFGLEGVLSVRDSHLPGYILQAGRRIKQFTPTQRDEMMATLEGLVAQLAPDEHRPFMDTTEVLEMAGSGIKFGSHTVSHPYLTELTTDGIREEVFPATIQVERLVGRAARDFAYPYGKFDSRVRREVKSLGAHSACTTRFGLVERQADPYALNRVNMCSAVAGREPLFAARVLGF